MNAVWHKPEELPEHLDPAKSVSVIAERKCFHKLTIANYWFDKQQWIMSGTKIVITIIRWQSKDKDIPDKQSPLYGGVK